MTMSVQLSRRWFLLGSAGALAAAAVPPAVAEVVKVILPAAPKLVSRIYSDMLFSIDWSYGHPGELFFYRDTKDSDFFFNVVCHHGAKCLWTSNPSSRLVLPDEQTLIIDFKTIDTTDWPGPGKEASYRGRRPGRKYRDDIPISTLAGNIMLVGARRYEDGREEGFSEVHKLPLGS